MIERSGMKSKALLKMRPRSKNTYSPKFLWFNGSLPWYKVTNQLNNFRDFKDSSKLGYEVNAKKPKVWLSNQFTSFDSHTKPWNNKTKVKRYFIRLIKWSIIPEQYRACVNEYSKRNIRWTLAFVTAVFFFQGFLFSLRSKVGHHLRDTGPVQGHTFGFG